MRPRKNDKVYYKGNFVGHVLSVDENLCWVSYPESMGGPNPFIWRFKKSDGYELNNLHYWDSKNDQGFFDDGCNL